MLLSVPCQPHWVWKKPARLGAPFAERLGGVGGRSPKFIIANEENWWDRQSFFFDTGRYAILKYKGGWTIFAKIILTALFAYLGWTAIDYFSRGDIIGGILGSVFSIIVGLVILVVSLSHAKGGKGGKEP